MREKLLWIINSHFTNCSTETMYDIRHSKHKNFLIQELYCSTWPSKTSGLVNRSWTQVCIWGIAPYHRKNSTYYWWCWACAYGLHQLLVYLSEGQSSVLMYSTTIAKNLFPYSIHHLFSPESLVLTQKYPYSHRMMYNCIEGQKISHSTRTVCHF